MARQKGLLIPKIKKGLHPDVIASAILMLSDDPTRLAYARGTLTEQELLERHVNEYEDGHGHPVWYIP